MLLFVWVPHVWGWVGGHEPVAAWERGQPQGEHSRHTGDMRDDHSLKASGAAGEGMDKVDTGTSPAHRQGSGQWAAYAAC